DGRYANARRLEESSGNQKKTHVASLRMLGSSPLLKARPRPRDERQKSSRINLVTSSRRAPEGNAPRCACPRRPRSRERPRAPETAPTDSLDARLTSPTRRLHPAAR